MDEALRYFESLKQAYFDERGWARTLLARRLRRSRLERASAAIGLGLMVAMVPPFLIVEAIRPYAVSVFAIGIFLIAAISLWIAPLAIRLAHPDPILDHVLSPMQRAMCAAFAAASAIGQLRLAGLERYATEAHEHLSVAREMPSEVEGGLSMARATAITWSLGEAWPAFRMPPQIQARAEGIATVLTRCEAAAVKGQRDFLLGGQQISISADT